MSLPDYEGSLASMRPDFEQRLRALESAFSDAYSRLAELEKSLALQKGSQELGSRNLESRFQNSLKTSDDPKLT